MMELGLGGAEMGGALREGARKMVERRRTGVKGASPGVGVGGAGQGLQGVKLRGEGANILIIIETLLFQIIFTREENSHQDAG